MATASNTTSKSRTTTAPTISAFAVSQLRRMGWTEGTGLGKDRQGRVEPLTVEQRVDGAGLGTANAKKDAVVLQDYSDQWWMDSLGDSLAKLQPPGQQTGRKVALTEDDLFAATGGARFGMRAGRTRNLSKWKRTEDDKNGKTKKGKKKRKRDKESGGNDDKAAKEKKRLKKEKKKRKKEKKQS